MNAVHKHTDVVNAVHNTHMFDANPLDTSHGTHGILNSVYEKSRLYNFFKLKLWSKQNYKNKLTSLIRNAENIYYTDRFETLKENIRGPWKLINHKRG